MASTMTNSNNSNPFMVTGLQAHVMQSTKEPCQSNGAHVNMSQIPMKRAHQIRPNDMSTFAWDSLELELELIQAHMTQKPMRGIHILKH